MLWLESISDVAAGVACSAALAALAWPVLRRFAGGSSHVSNRRVPDRLDAARPELTRREGAESRDWLRLAEKIARVGHWRYTIADRRLELSEEVFSIFGVPPDDGAPDLAFLYRLIAAEDRERARRGFENALSSASSFEFTVKIVRGGGAQGYVTARGIPEPDDAGGIAALFGVFVDITEQKRIEEELKMAHEASELANRALQALARHDAVTKLPNRRHFDETIASELKRAAREQQPVGLIMVDLDHFKSFNDLYGHPAGDACLGRVAAAVAGVPRRPADLVARYGGEELVVLLPNTDLIGTETVASRMVQAVRRLRIPHAGNQDHIVTVSCGAAMFDPVADAHNPVTLIERADQALYKAKHAGRNQAIAA